MIWHALNGLLPRLVVERDGDVGARVLVATDDVAEFAREPALFCRGRSSWLSFTA